MDTAGPMFDMTTQAMSSASPGLLATPSTAIGPSSSPVLDRARVSPDGSPPGPTLRSGVPFDAVPLDAVPFDVASNGVGTSVTETARMLDRGPVLSRFSFRNAVLKSAIVVADVVTVMAAYVLTTVIVAVWKGTDPVPTRESIVIAFLTLPVWPVLFARQQMYAARFLTRLMDELRRVVHVVVVGTVALVVVGWLVGRGLDRAWVLTFLVVAMALVSAERVAVRRWFVRRRRSGRSLRPVVVVGTNAEAIDLACSLAGDPTLGYQPVGFVATDPDAPVPPGGLPVLAGTADTVSFAHSLDAQGVILATTSLEVGLSNQLLRELLDGGLHVEMTSGLRDVTPERMTVRPLGRHPVVYLEPARRFGWRAVAKRIFDVVLSSIALVVAFPVLLVAAIGIKVTSPGPVLFRQQRVGRDGVPFDVLKLRTMVLDAESLLADLIDRNESDGPLFKLKDDPRVTSVGRILRKLSIDELPQLWNVVRGDMSLIGPRPALPREAAEWGDELHERLRVRPGITGMWQVSGRSDSGFEEYQRLDLFYVDNWSILIDLGILIRTVPAVITGRGAH